MTSVFNGFYFNQGPHTLYISDVGAEILQELGIRYTDGFKDYPIQPPEAFYHTGMREFILPYNIVRRSDSPDKILMSFLEITYEAEAITANWDRSTLERQ
jgi:hypothetical protein